MTNIAFQRVSMNSKTGPIPVTYSGAKTCPDACSFKKNGCYAEAGHVVLHWRKVTDGTRSIEWKTFLSELKKLPKRQLWRHNVAGDLPGTNNRINVRQLGELVAANAGRNGFTFTHKPLTPTNVKAIREANDKGFTVNLSADNLSDADTKANTGAGPVVVVLPEDAPQKGIKTPEGRTVVVCPAQTTEGMQCAQCGMCSVSTRKAIVGFRAHGTWRKKVSGRVSLNMVS